MSEFEVVFMWILVPFRFIVVVFSIILPVILVVKMKSSIILRKYKRVCSYVLCFLLSLGFIYLVFGNIDVPARVDVESINTNKDVLLSIDYGNYEFDTGYIAGNMYVRETNGYNIYEQKMKTYDIDDNTICTVSSVSCAKDARLSHAFEPTISRGIILIENNEKVLEINYRYNGTNISSVIWPITNPEITYRPKIDIADILESYDKIDETW